MTDLIKKIEFKESEEKKCPFLLDSFDTDFGRRTDRVNCNKTKCAAWVDTTEYKMEKKQVKVIDCVRHETYFKEETVRTVIGSKKGYCIRLLGAQSND